MGKIKVEVWREREKGEIFNFHTKEEQGSKMEFGTSATERLREMNMNMNISDKLYYQ